MSSQSLSHCFLFRDITDFAKVIVCFAVSHSYFTDKQRQCWVDPQHTSRVSCQKGPICHASAWRVGPFWQEDLIWLTGSAFSVYIHGVPDSKVHGANMGPTWVLSAPDGPHVGSTNLAIRGDSLHMYTCIQPCSDTCYGKHIVSVWWKLTVIKIQKFVFQSICHYPTTILVGNLNFRTAMGWHLVSNDV